jgi:hypothetical protein
MDRFPVRSELHHYTIDRFFSETPLVEKTPYLSRCQPAATPLCGFQDSLRQCFFVHCSEGIGDHLGGQAIGNSLGL